MRTVQDLLTRREIRVTKEEAKYINDFYQNLQHLKLDYDLQSDSTLEILLTQNTIKGGDHGCHKN